MHTPTRLWPRLCVAVSVGIISVATSRAGEPRVDKFGDPLPDGAIARYGTQRFRQGWLCRIAEFSPDGKWIACASPSFGFGVPSQGVCVWDAKTGVRVMQFLENTECFSLTFSPDGRYLAAGGYGLHVFDLTTRQLVMKAAGHQGETGVLCFAPDGKQIASGGWDHTVRVWDAATGKQVRQITTRTNTVWGLVYSPDGTRIASSGSEVCVWNPATGEEVAAMKWDNESLANECKPVAFTPDGRTLFSGGADGMFRSWDGVTFKAGRVIDTGHGPISVVACAPDGKTVVTGHNDGDVSVRDAATGAELRSWRPSFRRVGCVAFSRDGRSLLTMADWSSGPRVWDVATGRSTKYWDDHDSPVYCLRPAADGRTLYSIDYSHIALKWDLTTGNSQPWFTVFDNPFTRLRVSPDRKTCALTRYLGGPVRLWDVSSAKLLRTLDVVDSRNDANNQVDFSPVGRHLAVIEGNGVVSIWDWAEGRKERELKGHANLACVAYSPDGTRLAVGSGKVSEHTVRLWDPRTGQELGSIPATTPMKSIHFSPDGRWLATSGDYGPAVRIWSVATLREGPQVVGQSERTNYAYGFSLDSRYLAGISEGKAIRTVVWEVLTGEVVHQFSGHLGRVMSAAFAPDCQTLFTGGADSTILRWDLRHGFLAGESSPKMRQQWWSDLGDADAQTVLRAVYNLATTPAETAAMARAHLKPVALLSDEQSRNVRQWLADLESPRFAVREKAQTELVRLGDALLPHLTAAQSTSPEGRRRIKALIENLTAPIPDERLRRDLRAVQALEYAGGPECRKLLEELARGVPDARLTRAAKGAVERQK